MASGDNGLAALLESFGVGNKNVKTDRSNELAAMGNLKSLAAGEAGEGAEGVDASMKFFQSILSGNPTAVASAVAPTTNAVAAQNRNIAATGTSRGGGTNAEQQKTSDKAGAASLDAVQKLFPDAAKSSG